MRKARHPIHNDKLLISVADYRREFGNKPLKGRGRPAGVDDRQKVRCPFCPQRLTDCGGRSGSSIGHFSHLQNSGFCPSKSSAARPFQILAPVDPDPENARHLKRTFVKLWPWVFWKLRDLVPHFSVGEFIELLHEANRHNIWAYRHFEVWEIPYTLVVLNDFSPATGWKKQGKSQREYWYRFWYTTPNGKFSERWSDPQTRPELYAGTLRIPDKPRTVPGLADIHQSVEVRQESDYLRAPKPPVFQFIVDEVEAQLPRIFRLDAD